VPIDHWFPTLVYYESLQKSKVLQLNKDLVEECFQLRKVDDEGREWSEKNYVGGYTSYSTMNQLHKMSSTFLELEKKIFQHMKIFIQELDYGIKPNDMEMTDCWVNIMPAHTAHSMHIHPLSTISGTYYVQTPDKTAPIKFEDPRLSNFMATPPKKKRVSRQNKQIAIYKAEAGKVVLFESWLRHEVPARPSKKERISISFNYNWF